MMKGASGEPHLRETPRSAWISSFFFRTSRTWPFSGPFFTFSRPITYTHLGVRIKSLLMGYEDTRPERLVPGTLGMGSLASGHPPRCPGQMIWTDVSDPVRIYLMDKCVWAIIQGYIWWTPVPTLVEPISMGRCVWARCKSSSGGAWTGSQIWLPASASP